MFSKSTFGTTPSSTSFGFGSTNTNQNLFGQSSSLFGKPATAGFGSSNTTFGNPAPIFGSSTPLFPSNTSGTFGANQNQPAFGSTLFGNQQNANTAPTNRLFSQTTAPQTPFQSTSSTSLFGQSTGFGNTQTGTVIKFNPVTGTDTMQKSGVATNINTKHHCITCMKEYEGKSLEELRWEDYQANRKGPQQQGGFGVAPFGMTPTSSAQSLFGQSTDNKTTFGQMGTFNQSSGFGLGTQTGQTGSLFGKPNTTFGTTTTSSSFGFNNTPASNPFSTNPSQAFPQSKPLFGATNTQTSGFGGTGIFGQSGTQPTQSNMFGQNQTSGFGLNTGFGQMQQNQGGIFQTSKPATSFGPFSQTITSAPSFGQPTGTFGQSNAFNTFGKPAQSTFGNPQGSFGTSLGTQSNGGLFGNLQQKSGGFFGNTNPTSIFSGGTTFQPNTGFNLQQMQSQLNTLQPTSEQSEELKAQLQNAGTFGRSKILSGLTPLKEDDNKRTTNPRELKVILDSSLKVKLPSPIKNKPNMAPVNNSRMDVFDGAMGKTKFDSKDYIKMTRKRLIIRKKGDTEMHSNSSTEISLFDFEGDEVTDNNFTRKLQTNKETLELNANASNNRISVKPALKSSGENLNSSVDVLWLKSNNILNDANSSSAKNKYEGGIINDDTSGNDKRLEADKENFKEAEHASKHPCGITLTRPEYYTYPSLDQLTQYLRDDGTCIVQGFTIGRVGYGNVYYPDAFDVANLNLDKIIFFRLGEIIVYPDESATPPVGQGLNRRAQVTLDKVWPKTKDGSIILTDIKEINAINFVDKLQQICKKRNSKFMEYRPETGSWVFQVEHFSKHGLSDSDEEEVSEKVRKLRDKTVTEEHKTTDKEVNEKQKGKHSPLETTVGKPKEVVQVHDKSLPSNVSDPVDVFQMSEPVVGLGGFQLGLPKSNASVSSDDISPLDKNETFPSLRSSRHYIYKEVEPAQLALMKTSFFDERLHDIIENDSDENNSDLIKMSLNAVTDFQPEPKLVSVEKRVKQTSLLPRSFELRNRKCIVSNENSILHNRRNYKDMSVFLGRSFRVGWSVGNIFTNTSSSPTCTHNVQFCNLSSFIENDNNPFYRTLLNHLHITKENSKLSVNHLGVPMFKVNSGFNILCEHQELVSSNLKENDFNSMSFYYSCIWDLIIALWMPQGNLTRRDIFSNWLKRAVMFDVEKELCSQIEIDTGMNNVFNKIFTFLTGHRIDEAAKLALKNNLPQLSLQISQLNSVRIVKSFSEKQFFQWNTSGAVKHINEDLLKTYMLITGISVHQEINISESLDWKRALGLHLWYIIPVEQPISAVLKAYKKAFSELCYSRKPFPCHGDNVNYNTTDKYDILYHIISLFVYPYEGLHHILEPITYTNNPLDYSLSWFLMNTFEALDIGKITQDTKNYVHISFSNQLESMGYWQWAIFVLLFLKDENIRQNLIIKILERHLTSDLTEETLEMEEFLVNEFSIPSDWIHRTKGRRAKFENKNWEAYKHMILSKQWMSGHDFAFSKLIPDLMTHNDLYLLEKVLEILLPGHKTIMEWKVKGGLLLDFLNIWKLINNKQKGEIEESSLRAIEIDLLDLLARLKKFPITTNKKALSISECSKCIAFLLKKFYLELQNKSYANICKTSSYIESLVIAPDYKQDELIKSLFNMVNIQMIN
ncbi:nuclear pore complex protein Nup98-Nup96 isoform X2 [Agrilus planipennis]|uniref:Nuclear pore complex protein Nup98-Nup96 n=1 Tax=Agrilus planipennis TaxID=224129 RepID=A0A1W4X5Z8_AGRPL|nr:nuclear pore complex protein Nup98-Nup96 isoform X2 [Agrilus planipennis]